MNLLSINKLPNFPLFYIKINYVREENLQINSNRSQVEAKGKFKLNIFNLTIKRLFLISQMFLKSFQVIYLIPGVPVW